MREEVENSTIEIDGFNVKMGLKYLAMNEEYTGDLDELRDLMPKRMTKPWTKPTMKSKCVNNKEILDDDDWVYPTRMATSKERRMIMGRVAEIGTRVIFEFVCYRFGGVAYHQQHGGPQRGVRHHVCSKDGNAALGKELHQHLAEGWAEDTIDGRLCR